MSLKKKQTLEEIDKLHHFEMLEEDIHGSVNKISEDLRNALINTTHNIIVDEFTQERNTFGLKEPKISKNQI